MKQFCAAAAISLASLCGLSACASLSSEASQTREARALVRDAADTVASFAEAPEMAWLRENAQNAKGVVIAPQVLKGGFIFGGSGGNAIYLARDGAGWSEPAFYTLASVTFGLQIGGEVSEIILLVMTDGGVDALLSTDVKLGADVSVTAGPVGAGAKAQTADILAFSRSKGLYGGINLEGAVVKVRPGWNEAYYGEDLRPREIIFGNPPAGAETAVLRRRLLTLRP